MKRSFGTERGNVLQTSDSRAALNYLWCTILIFFVDITPKFGRSNTGVHGRSTCFCHSFYASTARILDHRLGPQLHEQINGKLAQSTIVLAPPLCTFRQRCATLCLSQISFLIGSATGMVLRMITQLFRRLGLSLPRSQSRNRRGRIVSGLWQGMDE